MKATTTFYLPKIRYDKLNAMQKIAEKKTEILERRGN